jgi:hypothetical protein
MEISYHLPPHTQIHRTKQTLSHTPAMQTMTMQLTTMQTTVDADNNAGVDADNDDTTQMASNDADNRGQGKQ